MVGDESKVRYSPPMLLTRASEMGIQCVVFLAGRKEDGMVTPQFVAERFESSPSYMSKVLQMLASPAHSGSL